MAKSVLIVQKLDRDIEQLSHHLVERGYKTYIARTLNDAKDLFDEHRPNLVLTSAIISGGSTSDLCRFIRARSARVPILVTSPIMTGTLQIEARTRWGADEFIVLPAPIGMLLRTIRYHLGEDVDRPNTSMMLQVALRKSKDQKTKEEARRKIPSAGELSRIPFEKLLLILGSARRTGEIRVAVESGIYTLSGSEGKVIAVSSPYIPELSLSSILVRERMVEQTRLSPLERRVELEKIQLGRLLMEAGMVKKDAIARALSLQYVEKVLQIIKMKEGSYRFRKTPVILPEDFPVELSVAQILFERYRREMTSQQFNKIYDEKMNKRLCLLEGGAFSIRDMKLTRDMKKLVLGLDGTKSIKEVLMNPDMTMEELIPLIHTLFQLKLVNLA